MKNLKILDSCSLIRKTNKKKINPFTGNPSAACHNSFSKLLLIKNDCKILGNWEDLPMLRNLSTDQNKLN